MDASSLTATWEASRQPVFLALMAGFALGVAWLGRRERVGSARVAWAPPRAPSRPVPPAEWPAALLFYETLWQTEPGHREAGFTYAWLCQQLGRPGEAAGAYERLLRQHPDDADALYNLGHVYFSLRLYEQAQARWAAAQRLTPRASDVRTNLRLLRMLALVRRTRPA